METNINGTQQITLCGDEEDFEELEHKKNYYTCSEDEDTMQAVVLKFALAITQ